MSIISAHCLSTPNRYFSSLFRLDKWINAIQSLLINFIWHFMWFSTNFDRSQNSSKYLWSLSVIDLPQWQWTQKKFVFQYQISSSIFAYVVTLRFDHFRWKSHVFHCDFFFLISQSSRIMGQMSWLEPMTMHGAIHRASSALWRGRWPCVIWLCTRNNHALLHHILFSHKTIAQGRNALTFVILVLCVLCVIVVISCYFFSVGNSTPFLSYMYV